MQGRPWDVLALRGGSVDGPCRRSFFMKPVRKVCGLLEAAHGPVGEGSCAPVSRCSSEMASWRPRTEVSGHLGAFSVSSGFS